jgi:hypothetical protein
MMARNDRANLGVAVVQEISTIPQRATIVHGHVPGDLLHPWLIGVDLNTGLALQSLR